jgi:hypothetical protein
MCACGVVLAACGTLAAPSTGDVDLPASYVGPYLALSSQQTPSGAQTLVNASQAGEHAEEPSIVRVDAQSRRMAFVTLSATGQSDTIGLATERMDHAAGSLMFTGAASIFQASQSWEGSFVRSPDVRAIDASHFVMAYAAQGGIGIATSSDGMTFTHPNAPVIQADVLDGGSDAPAEPTIAKSPTGEWFMIFRRGTSLFLARAQVVNGPWMVSSTPMLAPSVVDAPDAGNAFDSVSLSDPTLTITTTPTGRTIFILFYTATGPAPRTAIGAAASYDGTTWSRVPRVLFQDRLNSVRAGSLDIIDARTALLWIGTGAPDSRGVGALIGPAVPRATPPGS